MKLLFNILSTVSFLGMAGIVGGGAYVYVQRDAIIESVKEAAIEVAGVKKTIKIEVNYW